MLKGKKVTLGLAKESSSRKTRSMRSCWTLSGKTLLKEVIFKIRLLQKSGMSKAKQAEANSDAREGVMKIEFTLACSGK